MRNEPSESFDDDDDDGDRPNLFEMARQIETSKNFENVKLGLKASFSRRIFRLSLLLLLLQHWDNKGLRRVELEETVGAGGAGNLWILSLSTKLSALIGLPLRYFPDTSAI